MDYRSAASSRKCSWSFCSVCSGSRKRWYTLPTPIRSSCSRVAAAFTPWHLARKAVRGKTGSRNELLIAEKKLQPHQLCWSFSPRYPTMTRSLPICERMVSDSLTSAALLSCSETSRTSPMPVGRNDVVSLRLLPQITLRKLRTLCLIYATILMQLEQVWFLQHKLLWHDNSRFEIDIEPWEVAVIHCKT